MTLRIRRAVMVWGVLLTTLAGCVPAATMTSARTLDAGRIHLAFDAIVVHSTDPEETLPQLPGFNVEIGMSDGAELGLRLGEGMVQFRPKFRLTTADSRFVASLMPAAGGMVMLGGPNGNLALGMAGLTALVGVRVGETAEIHVAPKVLGMLIDSYDDTSFAFVGATAAVNQSVGWGLTLHLEGGYLRQLSSHDWGYALPDLANPLKNEGWFGGLSIGWIAQEPSDLRPQQAPAAELP